MSKKNKTRQERLRLRRNVASGIAWLILCVVVACVSNFIADNVISNTPMGVYAEEAE